MQLQQGERLALESDDSTAGSQKFSAFPIVQLIDLDAAMGAAGQRGAGPAICGHGCPARSAAACARSSARRSSLPLARTGVILGSSLFNDAVNASAEAFAEALGPERFIGAIDSRGGNVVIHGWKTTLAITPRTRRARSSRTSARSSTRTWTPRA